MEAILNNGMFWGGLALVLIVSYGLFVLYKDKKATHN